VIYWRNSATPAMLGRYGFDVFLRGKRAVSGIGAFGLFLEKSRNLETSKYHSAGLSHCRELSEKVAIIVATTRSYRGPE
jgi:hypothetical protein